MGYLNDIQDDIANASMIDNGLKKGIEYRVPSGCIIELDALYAGDNVGGVTNLANGATKQPTEDDCCSACKLVPLLLTKYLLLHSLKHCCEFNMSQSLQRKRKWQWPFATNVRSLYGRTTQGCNVFTFCPSFEGCNFGGQVAAAFACQLKFLGNLSSDPTAFPAALARGPPVSFKSGKPLWISVL